MTVMPTDIQTADNILKRFISEFLYFLIFHAATLLCFSHSMEHELSYLFITFYHSQVHPASCFLRKKPYRPVISFGRERRTSPSMADLNSPCAGSGQIKNCLRSVQGFHSASAGSSRWNPLPLLPAVQLSFCSAGAEQKESFPQNPACPLSSERAGGGYVKVAMVLSITSLYLFSFSL